MNCKQLNENKLSDILLIFGYHPIRQNKNELWYLNPFSKETKASFKIDNNKNLWYLHSEGVGGNVVDFLVRYLKYSIPEVLKWAEDRNFSFSFQKQNCIEETSYSIKEVRKLYSYPLKNYLNNRGITDSTWKCKSSSKSGQ